MPLCDSCGRRRECTELCPEAAAYADAGVAPMRELPIGIPRPETRDYKRVLYRRIQEIRAAQAVISETEKIVLALRMVGLSWSKIAETVRLSTNQVRYIVDKYIQAAEG